MLHADSVTAELIAHLHHSSIWVATERRTLTALSGKAPAADSPDSMRASARCLTTSAMSATCMQLPIMHLAG